ncbi:MAG TPA: aminoglycoside phosphotransferase family protein [Propionibacteriaceae bacterium]|nr:aminoglycoside phosphotransferase family protein [Propionibacteriaceae bacterium]
MLVDIPEHFAAFRHRSQDWADWLDALPRLIRTVVEEWSVTVDGPPWTGQGALALPVVTPRGERAVLKLGWPHPEAAYEHLALRTWGGRGAVRLLQADPRRWVYLLERADASHDLHALSVREACEVVAGLYQQLHVPAIPQLDRLSVQAERWTHELLELRNHPSVPRRYVEQAAALARDFAADPASDGILIHTDLHYFNVLAAVRQPWLAIDPKPLSGEPAYEVAPLLWNRWDEAVATGDVRGALLDRLFTVVDAAGLEEDRVRDWVTVREMVNVMWTLREGSDAPPNSSDWVTAAITIVKAVQR